MNESELGKHEEPTNASSAELPESETATPQDVSAASAEAPAEAKPEAHESVEPVAEPAEVPAEASTESSAPSAPADAGGEAPSGLKRGTIVTGKVLRTSPVQIVIDLGEGREGVVASRELENISSKLLTELQEGSEIDVYIVNPRNNRGETVLSITQAQEEIDWRMAAEYLENKQVYDGRVGGYNKGGLIVRFGLLRGFVPQSQISETRLRGASGDTPEERYGRIVNQNISVKVMEVDRARNRLILSERAAMREVRQRRKESLITELGVGEEREGTVVSLENFGAFVDIGGAEGLIHLTELSWNHITHPRQVLNVGDTVRVRVISVDTDHNRIGLSLRQLQTDPWDEIRAQYAEGSLVKGIITKLTKFGAFARIVGDQAIEGLIHISELSDERVEHPREVVQRGDELTLRVVKVDVKNRRLGLSLKRVHSAEYLDIDMSQAYTETPADRQSFAEKLSATLQSVAQEVREEVEEAVEDLREEVQEIVEKVRDALDGDEDAPAEKAD